MNHNQRIADIQAALDAKVAEDKRAKRLADIQAALDSQRVEEKGRQPLATIHAAFGAQKRTGGTKDSMGQAKRQRQYSASSTSVH